MQAPSGVHRGLVSVSLLATEALKEHKRKHVVGPCSTTPLTELQV